MSVCVGVCDIEPAEPSDCGASEGAHMKAKAKTKILVKSTDVLLVVILFLYYIRSTHVLRGRNLTKTPQAGPRPAAGAATPPG